VKFSQALGKALVVCSFPLLYIYIEYISASLLFSALKGNWLVGIALEKVFHFTQRRRRNFVRPPVVPNFPEAQRITGRYIRIYSGNLFSNASQAVGGMAVWRLGGLCKKYFSLHFPTFQLRLFAPFLFLRKQTDVDLIYNYDNLRITFSFVGLVRCGPPRSEVLVLQEANFSRLVGTTT